jgi:hypothetical protein
VNDIPKLVPIPQEEIDALAASVACCERIAAEFPSCEECGSKDVMAGARYCEQCDPFEPISRGALQGYIRARQEGVD